MVAIELETQGNQVHRQLQGKQKAISVSLRSRLRQILL